MTDNELLAEVRKRIGQESSEHLDFVMMRQEFADPWEALGHCVDFRAYIAKEGNRIANVKERLRKR